MQESFFNKYRDVLSSVIMALAAIAYLAGSSQIRQYGDAAVDSRFFPQVLGSLLLLLSLVLLVMSILRLRNRDVDVDEVDTGTFSLLVPVALGIIIAYIFLIPRLGFVLSSILFLIAQTFLMAPMGRRRPVLTIAVSVAFCLAVNYVFVEWFSLALPDGIFG